MTKKMTSSLAITSAVAGAITLGIAAFDANEAVADGHQDKCYGVAKAGMNDCGDKLGKHSCAGQSKVDGDPNEWIYTPKGLCDKLVNGHKG